MAKPSHGPKAMAEGWALAGWLSLAVGVLVLLILASRGAGTDDVRAVVRTTPKLSVILFLSAFLAAPLLAYLFIFAMTATSFDPTAGWLGVRRWRHLHTFGLYYIWMIFFYSYIPRAFQSPVYIPFAVLLLGAMGDANLRPGSEASLGTPGSLAPTMMQ